MDTILATPSVQVVDISIHNVNPNYEDFLAAEALVTPNTDRAQEMERVIRNYRSTLVKFAPSLDSRCLSTSSPFWTFNDVAIVCSDAYGSVRRRLRVVGKQCRDRGISTLFNPLRDIVCLEGLQSHTSTGLNDPFFANLGP